MQDGEVNVSIHAPKYGATSWTLPLCLRVRCFNPRTQVWCDVVLLYYTTYWISFNPRTQVWCDWKVYTATVDEDRFQSTHPSMVRLRPYQDYTSSMVFQSTHPSMVRHRLYPQRIEGRGYVSIHAPKYGATASPKSIITQELELCTNL